MEGRGADSVRTGHLTAGIGQDAVIPSEVPRPQARHVQSQLIRQALPALRASHARSRQHETGGACNTGRGAGML